MHVGLTSVLARSLTYNTHSHAACGAAGISLDLSHVMANVNHRAKSADPVGMGVSALNNDDQGAYEGGGAGGGWGGGGGRRIPPRLRGIQIELTFSCLTRR